MMTLPAAFLVRMGDGVGSIRPLVISAHVLIIKPDTKLEKGVGSL